MGSKPFNPIEFMMRHLFPILCAFMMWTVGCADQSSVDAPAQYLLISVPTYHDSALVDIANTFETHSNGKRALGAGMIVSYLSQPSEEIEERLRNFLKMAEDQSMPIVLEMEGINYWQARPDLWNWWMPDKPGYDPDNKMNVEWTSWSAADAVKVGWRNWGSQHRVLPMPNLSSPAYMEACEAELKKLIPIVLEWWKGLPEEKKHLLVGIQLGVEISIGANNWYYPDGNNLLDKPVADDPDYGLHHEELPGRGVQPIGYAAVKTLGIADSGKLTEWQVTQAVDRYVLRLSELVSSLGVPREKLFIHAGGWKPGESVYGVAMNEYACPGWSFYEHARDVSGDRTAMMVVDKSDAPFWAVAEWMDFSAKSVADWVEGYENAFSLPGVRYLQVRHWGEIAEKPEALDAIREMLKE